MVELVRLGIASAAISLRGHGASKGNDGLQDFCLEDYVQDVFTALAHLAHPVILVGHSMGGLVCQLAAAQRSLRRLVLMAPSPITGMRREGARMALRHPFTFLAAFSRRSFLRLYRDPLVRRSLLYHSRTPEAIISDAQNSLVEESWKAGNQMNSLLPSPLQVRCPVVVVGAAEDFMISAASIKATARAYNVDPIFIHGSGHMIQSEVPAPDLAVLLRTALSD
jgi:pimeloyl-ACP methyl ester carboxylesterase